MKIIIYLAIFLPSLLLAQSPPQLFAQAVAAQQKADNGKRRLHRKPPLVRRLPLPKERSVIEHRPRWMLRNVDIQRRPSEERGCY